MSEFIENNRLGWRIGPDLSQAVIQSILAKVKSKEVPDSNFDIRPYTFRTRASELIDILKELN